MNTRTSCCYIASSNLVRAFGFHNFFCPIYFPACVLHLHVFLSFFLLLPFLESFFYFYFFYFIIISDVRMCRQRQFTKLSGAFESSVVTLSWPFLLVSGMPFATFFYLNLFPPFSTVTFLVPFPSVGRPKTRRKTPHKMIV